MKLAHVLGSLSENSYRKERGSECPIRYIKMRAYRMPPVTIRFDNFLMANLKIKLTKGHFLTANLGGVGATE